MKTTLSLLFSILLILLTPSVYADDTIPQNKVRYIDVTGSSEMLIEPNELHFSIELKEFMRGKEKVTLDTLEKQLNAAIQAANIPTTNLTLVRFNAAQYYKNRKNQEFLGTKNLKLKINTTTQLDQFFAALENSDLKNVKYDQAYHTEIQKFRQETKVNAVKAAQLKAKAMVESIGVKLGPPIYIIELPEKVVNTYSNSNVKYSYKELEEDKGAFGTDIAFENIRLFYEVSVRFEIIP